MILVLTYKPTSTSKQHAGLVSITAGCGNMECGSAVATGFIGGLVYQGLRELLQFETESDGLVYLS